METINPSTPTTSITPAPMPIQTPIVVPVLPKEPGEDDEVPSALASVLDLNFLEVLEGERIGAGVVLEPDPTFSGAVIWSLGLVVELSLPPIETKLELAVVRPG